jgi:hypothetical protein
MMPRTRSRLKSAQRVEAAAAAALIAVAVVGVALLAVSAPPFTRLGVAAVGSAANAGLPADTALALAEDVRRFVTSTNAEPLPSTLEGRLAFDGRSVEHLVDVRGALVAARTGTLLLLALLAFWLFIRQRAGRSGRRLIGASALAAGTSLLAAAALGLLAGALDFDALFTWFHGLFFAEGTWLFPPDSLLIQLFPLPFWVTAGATWAAFVVAGSVTLVGIGWRLMFTTREDV